MRTINFTTHVNCEDTCQESALVSANIYMPESFRQLMAKALAGLYEIRRNNPNYSLLIFANSVKIERFLK